MRAMILQENIMNSAKNIPVLFLLFSYESKHLLNSMVGFYCPSFVFRSNNLVNVDKELGKHICSLKRALGIEQEQ